MVHLRAPQDEAPRTAGAPRGTLLDGDPRRIDSAQMDLSMNRHAALVIFGVATALGVFSALQAYNYVSFFAEQEQPFSVLLALNLSYWYAWALLVPFMLWMAQRFRFERQRWVLAVAAHLCGVPPALHQRTAASMASILVRGLATENAG